MTLRAIPGGSARAAWLPCCSSSAHATPVSAENGYPARDSGFHSYPEMVAEIRKVAAAHPDIVRVSSIGRSYQGRTIWVVEVSDHVGRDEGEPEVLFDALHHAREHLTPEMALYTLHLLADQYGQDSRPRAARHRPGGQPTDLDHPHGQP